MSLCCGSKKSTVIVAGVFTLIQGLVWCVLATLLLLFYDCTIKNTDASSRIYHLYLVYLYNGRCDPVTIDVYTENETISIPWPESGTTWSLRTYIWILIYLVLSSLWVLAALLLLIATMSNVTGLRGIKLRLPWLFLTSIFLIVDVIAMLMYAIDISHTSDLESLLRFAGVEIPEAVSSSESVTSLFGNFTVFPSVIFTIAFSRGIIVWGCNLVFLMYVVQHARNEESKPRTAVPEPRKPYQEYMKKLSTIGPVPDISWDPYQRKRSEVPIIKPLKIPSPPNERKRKQSDYQQYMFYAKHLPQDEYLVDNGSLPPTPSTTVPTTTDPRNLRKGSNHPEKDEGFPSKSSRQSDQDIPSIPRPDYNR